jgi:protein TonB
VTPPPKPPEKTLAERIEERLKNQEKTRPKEQPADEQKPREQAPSGSTKITAGKVADYYLTMLQGKITRNWKQPSARFTGGDEITVRVSFTVLRNGDLTGLKVARASGWSTVDQSALQAVRSSAPFGALPPTYKDDRLDVTIDFTVTQ